MERRGKATCRKANRRDAGQILPMVAIVLVVVALMGLVVVRLGMQVDRRAQAQAAADAVALAGAAEGEDRAGSVAEANRVVLESFEARGHEVEVVVRLGDERATARAKKQW
jgi:Tfp pilus assembly protein PilX